MIDENGRGVLIDWELAIRVKDENGTLARQHDRTVSHLPAFLWPLVSNFIHRVPQKAHALPDDQQSFLWIGRYYILLTFNPVILDNPDIDALISDYFEKSKYNRKGDYFTGGLAKGSVIRGDSVLCHLTVPNKKQMEQWFKKMLKVFTVTDLQKRLEANGFDSERLPDQLRLPKLDKHDGLEWIFRGSLDAEGWSLVRDAVDLVR
jgi:hypothetical protein